MDINLKSEKQGTVFVYCYKVIACIRAERTFQIVFKIAFYKVLSWKALCSYKAFRLKNVNLLAWNFIPCFY